VIIITTRTINTVTGDVASERTERSGVGPQSHKALVAMVRRFLAVETAVERLGSPQPHHVAALVRWARRFD
jgi:hypothetical protein